MMQNNCTTYIIIIVVIVIHTAEDSILHLFIIHQRKYATLDRKLIPFIRFNAIYSHIFLSPTLSLHANQDKLFEPITISCKDNISYVTPSFNDCCAKCVFVVIFTVVKICNPQNSFHTKAIHNVTISVHYKLPLDFLQLNVRNRNLAIFED